MKKALAVVLAVIMLGTLAFAADISAIPGGSASTDVITLDPDNTATYQYAPIRNIYFYVAACSDSSVPVVAERFKVEGLTGKFLTGNKWGIRVENNDVALDGKVDLTLPDEFTIRYINDGTKKLEGCYATFVAKDGEYAIKEVCKNGVPLAESEWKDLGTPKLAVSYDVGKETVVLKDASDKTTLKDGKWHRNTEDHELAIPLGTGVVTLKVPAKATFKFSGIFGPGGSCVWPAAMDAKLDHGFKVTAPASLSYRIPADNGINDHVYAVDPANGKCYESGLKFVVEKNSLGSAKGYWTGEYTAYPYAVGNAHEAMAVGSVPSSIKPVGAEKPADPKNPATGANDVVGVAAALAVVALVSGAAISLKK